MNLCKRSGLAVTKARPSAFTLFVFLSIPAFSQIPGSIARVERIDFSNPTVPQAIIENVGDRAITGLVIASSNPPTNMGDFTTLNYSGGAGLTNGATISTQAWPNSDLENTYVAAVIFEDGSTLGDHKDRDGSDVLAALFLERIGTAKEWTTWKSALGSHSDPQIALQSLVSTVHEMSPLKENLTSEQKGRFLVQQEVLNIVHNLESRQPSDADALTLVQAITSRTSDAVRFAVRK